MNVKGGKEIFLEGVLLHCFPLVRAGPRVSVLNHSGK